MAVGSPRSRAIRVFLSSTFRDMQAERDELRKQIFPQLRKLCESRSVTWGELDLRWGIDTSDEPAAEEKVLRTCLDEVERCRPFFIGMLGERYGRVPDEFAPALIERESWLAEHLGRSVTELEILHGVLNDPAAADHAFFYLRSPSYIDTLPEGDRPAFREGLAPDEVEHFGAEEAARRADERRDKLAALKERITSSFPVPEDYADPAALGELVLADLTAVIDWLYPEGSELEPLDREATEHDIFAQSRFGVYIGRKEYFERLDAHVQGEGPPLVVLGESGSGKSALLANWAERHQAAGTKKPDEELFLFHFIGATPASADWAAMLRRILGEFQRRLGVEVEMPDQPDELRATFANALHQAAARGRVVLVLDALNQLEDRDQAPNLVWLPPVIPKNVRLIFSTLPGRPLEELSKRGWPTLDVEPLEPEERKRLIAEYLAQSSRELSPKRVERIAAAPQSANPLFLRATLEELTLWGDHDTLDEPIDDYLSATDPEDLYAKILTRYEQDYERERPGLVKEAMSLLWAARRGLAEAELLDLLGADGAPLPAAHWSPLYLAADKALVSRSGSVGFFHDYLRQAVRRRYLPGDAEQEAMHLRLADYFAAQDLGSRKVDELPWQLAEAGAWARLANLLADPPFFGVAWDNDPFEVKAYWARVEARSEHRLLDGYRAVLTEPRRHRAWIWPVALLLVDTGHPREAGALWSYTAEEARELGDKAGLHRSLGNQAVILKARGELDEALALHKEVERLCRELGDKAGLSGSLNNQALILRARGELDAAMALLKEQERLCRELGDKAGLSASLGNQALILKTRGELDEAMALLKEQERLCRELGDKAGLHKSLGGQALILRARGELDAAMALLKEQERLCRELGDKAWLSASLGNQALILRARGELDAAMALLKEQERLCQELGDKAGLSASLGGQALILRARGELDAAMALHKEEERLCRELEDKEGLHRSLGNRAAILQGRGEPDEAMALHKEEERLCRELGDKAGLSTALGNQGLILRARGELDAATALLKEAERLWRELGDKAGLSASLGGQALILYDQGELDAAMALLKEAERLCRELGDKAGLSKSLGSQAVILQGRGELDEAMALHKEAERLCRELGSPEGLATSLANQAVVYTKLHRPLQALPLAEEAYELAVGHGLLQLASQMKPVLDGHRARAGAAEPTSAPVRSLVSDRRPATPGRPTQLDEAIVLLEQQVEVRRAQGLGRELAESLLDQAVLLGQLGEWSSAREKAAEAREIFTRLDLPDAAARASGVLMASRISTPTRRKVLLAGVVLIAGLGVAMGLWNPWLWLIGGPLVLFCVFYVAASASPRLQQAVNDAARRLAED